MKTNLEIVREKVREAVPEIMELKFGVPFISTEEGLLNQYIFLEESSVGAWNVYDIEKGDMLHTDFKSELVQILGRPIQLADVLRAIESKHSWPPYRIGTHGLFFFAKEVSATPSYVSTGVMWDMSKPLDGQSPETLQFLAEILK